MLKQIVLFIFFLGSHASIAFADSEPLFLQEREKKYNLSICAIFKNEAPYLKEWIEYHHIAGVDHFYLYNIGSEDSFRSLLKPYIDKELVTYINWPEALVYSTEDQAEKWALSTQIPAYENAVNFIARNETNWLLIMDIDEYLVCHEGCNIEDVLIHYHDYAGISIASDHFDAGIYDKCRKKLLVQSFDLICSPKPIVDKSVTKMIFKPENCAGFIWPPYQCCFREGEKRIALGRNELRINRYLNRNIKKKNPKFKLEVDNRQLCEYEVAELLRSGFVIEDQERSIHKHIPELMKRLGL